jgi:hypothetical protein
MTWFKGDDGWHKHRKRIRAGLDLTGLAAQGLWFAAGTWCADELTDGWVPSDVVDYLAPGISAKERGKLVERLVRAGLWVPTEKDGESGWVFHDWLDRNPSRKQVESEREAAAKRQRDARERARDARRSAAKQSADSRSESQRESRRDMPVTAPVTHNGSHGVSTSSPTRPDPTRPELPTEVQNQEPLQAVGSLTQQDPNEVRKAAPTSTINGRVRNARCNDHGENAYECLGCLRDYGSRTHNAPKRTTT